MKPKIFVGTLHSNECDFMKCCDAVHTQDDVVITHKVISGLSERDAHNALWQEWKNSQNDHDFFVKVDADTILASSTTIIDICETIKKNEATGLQAPLHDYMTDSLIDGLNAYANTVTFHESKDSLFCDRNVCSGNHKVLRESELPSSLKPAGYHGHNTSPLHAYHYGVHRMIKGQKQIILRVIENYKVHRDRTRGFAIIGAASAGLFMDVGKHPGKFNYTDQEFMQKYEATFEKYDLIMQRNSIEQFEHTIRRALEAIE